MKQILFILLCSMGAWLHAQVPTLQDKKLTVNDVRIVDGKLTGDGGHILLGEKTANVNGGNSIYLAKLKLDGSKEWERELGRLNISGYVGSIVPTPVPLSVQQTNDGGYLILAVYSYLASSILTFNPNPDRDENTVNYGILILKTDKNGNVPFGNSSITNNANAFQKRIEQSILTRIRPFPPVNLLNWASGLSNPRFEYEHRGDSRLPNRASPFLLSANGFYPFVTQVSDGNYLLVYNKIQNNLIETNDTGTECNSNPLECRRLYSQSNPVIVKLRSSNGDIINEQTISQDNDVLYFTWPDPNAGGAARTYQDAIFGEECIYDLCVKPNGSVHALSYPFRAETHPVGVTADFSQTPSSYASLLAALNPPFYKNSYFLTTDRFGLNASRVVVTNNSSSVPSEGTRERQAYETASSQIGETYYKVRPTGDGGLILLGKNGDYSSGSYLFSPLVRKLSANGQEAWKKTDITVGGDLILPLDIVPLNDGGYLLVRGDNYLKKIDKDGNFGGTGTWETTLSGVTGGAVAAYQGFDGAYYLVGGFDVNGTEYKLIKLAPSSDTMKVMYVDHFTGDASEANKAVLKIGGTAADQKEIETLGNNTPNLTADWIWQNGKTYLWKWQYDGTNASFTLYNGTTPNDGGTTVNFTQPYTVRPNGLEIKANVNSGMKSGTKATIHLYSVNGKSVGPDCKAEAIGDETSNFWSKVYFISQEFQRTTGFTALGTVRISWTGTNPQDQNKGGSLQFQVEPNYDVTYDGATYR
jgi:hypothetical protein